jgi:dTDP-glucose 4,6-dehydratase
MAKATFLICGGCGFIGSTFVHLLHKQKRDAELVVFDLLTYAGSKENLGELVKDPRVRFIKGDIADSEDLKQMDSTKFDLVINLAAETHVDRSLYHADRFVRSNVLGVTNLLAFCRDTDSPFLQISTDEVYGPAAENQRFTEDVRLNPSSPYSASKAAADLMVTAAVKTYSQPAAIVRTCNNYGPRQFPEKLIPFFLHLARQNKPLPLYGDGRQRRCWIHVDDFCAALLRLLDDFPAGDTFNIGSETELENQQIADQIIAATESRSEVKSVPDRPAHDSAYRIDSSLFRSRYGWVKQRDFAVGLRETVDWYLENDAIFRRLDSADTRDFLESHYRDRS